MSRAVSLWHSGKKDREIYREGRRQSQESPEEACALQSAGPPDGRASEGADLLVKIKVGSRVRPHRAPTLRPPPHTTSPVTGQQSFLLPEVSGNTWWSGKTVLIPAYHLLV
ncbi:unnamed protein product [Rangifer tarandus platyrhynchus]|uniref:Uncharacterized protein n=1 Tax=Rangifer tarandus platyrhynchus TaxID=3082113 RepID=A0ABN8Y4B9_RANTA|nr:unnamed protein product [Rangifer tarandus platyrhynchus]